VKAKKQKKKKKVRSPSLKSGAHNQAFSHLSLTTHSRLYIIHDIDVNVVQNHALFREMGAFPEYATENDTGFG